MIFKLIIAVTVVAGEVCLGENAFGTSRKSCPPMKNIPQPPVRVDTLPVLARLRKEMRSLTSVRGPPIDAYIVTSNDQHMSPILAEPDQRLKFVSGFSGSHGVGVITQEKAALWTEPLYTSQADDELSCDWLLMTQSKDDITIGEWLKQELKQGKRVGANPNLLSSSQWKALSKELTNASSLNLLALKNDLVDITWTQKPEYKKKNITVWPLQYAEKTWQSKLSKVREEMRRKSCDALVLTALDEIAWLLNIRGKDIPHLPVVRSYALVTREQLHFYVDSDKLTNLVKQHLHTESCFSPFCARVHDYDAIFEDLKTLSQIWNKVWLPSDSPLSPGVSQAISLTIPFDKAVHMVSPIVQMKAQKNSAERVGMKKAHLRDAAAFCDFMGYMQWKMSHGDKWDEMRVAMTLDQFRKEQLLSEGISFRTTVGFAAHSSHPHYKPSNLTSIKIDNTSLLMIDSGGHYTDGTTDVTRTFHLGTPTPEQIEIYTRVLMGLMNVALLTFPQHLPVTKVDSFARAPLWDGGLDYQHKSGHGIGAFLSVHEGPVMLSDAHPQLYDYGNVFKEGYFFTVEPGYYKENQFGVRLENVFEVVQKPNSSGTGVKYLGFESATMIPFEPKLIDLKKLSPQQVKWLNEYHRKIRSEIGSELKRQSRMKGLYWILEKAVHFPEPLYGRGDSVKPFFFIVPLLTLFHFFR